MRELLTGGANLIGFTDGSWKRKNSSIQAGIGGLILEPSGDAIYTFSGPSKAIDAFETEWEALIILIKNFVKSEWKSKSLQIFSDSRNTICRFLEKLANPCKDDNRVLAQLIRGVDIKANYIPRELNFQADNFAK
ncbi:hypothetical protein ACET3Z_011636 [Daucus carota]